MKTTPARSVLRTVAFPLFLALFLSACALGRSVVEIKPPASTGGTATEGKAFAKIVEVEDRRQFAASPNNPSMPSLQDAAEITNPAITARAVARKRGGYGAAFGDILLPEGQTVAGLVRSAAQRALQDKGYAVVEDGAPQYAAALPLEIEINEFWSWFTPGLFAITTEFRSTLKIEGDALIGDSPAPVSSYIKDQGLGATDSTWTELIQRGVNDLSDRIKDRIKPAAN